jgi:3-hydroxyisobutyrate dehydrogenase-like beta-hydroxyacid dehydrogenase
MGLHLKDLRIALAEADRLALPMEVTRLVADQARRLVDAGYGGEDSSSLARVARGEIAPS